MRAVVFRGIGNIRLEDVDEPRIVDSSDAIVRLTTSAICGTDLHFVRGSITGMKPGTVLGHEGVGIVEEIGPEVRNLKPGDRVVIPSTICCGFCPFCRAGLEAQCDNANPRGKLSGTAFYGGPENTGPFDGLQAEKARIPFAQANLIKLPQEISDDQAILLSDVFPTGYFGATLAEVSPGDTVAVFGCGPVGQFAVTSAKHLGAGRIFAVDSVHSRLVAARAQGAEAIDYTQEHPVETIRRLTGGVGADRVIDAVGIDSFRAHEGPAAHDPGDASTQALRWEVEVVAKAGTLAIIGVYPETLMVFPIGKAMQKNLTLRMGNCNHRKFIPRLLDLVRAGIVDPSMVITQHQTFTSAIDAYQSFEKREAGWIKVVLKPDPYLRLVTDENPVVEVDSGPRLMRVSPPQKRRPRPGKPKKKGKKGST